MRLTSRMGSATIGVAGVTMAALLLPSVGPCLVLPLPNGAAGAATRPAVPTAAANASLAMRVTALAGGLYHSLALTSNGAVLAWGWNITGQLCNGTTNGSDVLAKVGPLAWQEGDRDSCGLCPQPGGDLDRRGVCLRQKRRRRTRRWEHYRQRRADEGGRCPQASK